MNEALEKIRLAAHRKILTHAVVADFNKSALTGFYGQIFEDLKNKGIL